MRWVLAAILVSGVGWTQVDPGDAQGLNTLCPVMPEKSVDEDSMTLTHDGKVVRLCCKKCVARFREAPGDFLHLLPQFRAAAAGEGQPPMKPTPTPAAQSAIGRFHVVVIHFPVALLLVAGFLDALALLRGAPLYGSSVRPLVILGAVSAVVSSFLGLELAGDVVRRGAAQDVLELHRTLGLLCAGSAVAALGVGEWFWRKKNPTLAWLYASLLLTAMGCVAAGAHQGGLLVHGLDYF